MSKRGGGKWGTCQPARFGLLRPSTQMLLLCTTHGMPIARAIFCGTLAHAYTCPLTPPSLLCRPPQPLASYGAVVISVSLNRGLNSAAGTVDDDRLIAARGRIVGHRCAVAVLPLVCAHACVLAEGGSGSQSSR